MKYLLFLSVILLVFTSQTNYLQAQKILYIGGNSESDPRKMDQDLVDSLNAWGYEATYMAAGTYKSASADVYNGYDGIWINESVGSTDVARFSDDNFPLDIIVMEPAPLAGSWGLGMGIEATDGNQGDYILKIENNEHYITEIYDVGEELVICSNPQYDHTGILFDNGGVVTDILASVTNTQKRDGGTISPGGFELGTIDTTASRPIRMCLFCLTSPNYDNKTTSGDINAVNYATDKFYEIVKRSAEWTFRYPEEEISQVLSAERYQNPELQICQDFNDSRLIINYKANRVVHAKLSVFDMNGRLLKVLYDGLSEKGNNFVQLNKSEYGSGIYLIRLEMDTGETDLLRIGLGR